MWKCMSQTLRFAILPNKTDKSEVSAIPDKTGAAVTSTLLCRKWLVRERWAAVRSGFSRRSFGLCSSSFGPPCCHGVRSASWAQPPSCLHLETLASVRFRSSGPAARPPCADCLGSRPLCRVLATWRRGAWSSQSRPGIGGHQHPVFILTARTGGGFLLSPRLLPVSRGFLY